MVMDAWKIVATGGKYDEILWSTDVEFCSPGNASWTLIEGDGSGLVTVPVRCAVEGSDRVREGFDVSLLLGKAVRLSGITSGVRADSRDGS